MEALSVFLTLCTILSLSQAWPLNSTERKFGGLCDYKRAHCYSYYSGFCPQCDYSGNFLPQQCKWSWPNQHCWCVDVITGEKIPNTDAPLGMPSSHCDNSWFCPEGWFNFGEKCYTFINTSKKWLEAEIYCQFDGANLASVHSEEENRFIMSLTRGDTHNFPQTWLGGFDVIHPGYWIWSDGSSFNYKNWYNEQPYVKDDHDNDHNHDSHHHDHDSDDDHDGHHHNSHQEDDDDHDSRHHHNDDDHDSHHYDHDSHHHDHDSHHEDDDDHEGHHYNHHEDDDDHDGHHYNHDEDDDDHDGHHHSHDSHHEDDDDHDSHHHDHDSHHEDDDDREGHHYNHHEDNDDHDSHHSNHDEDDDDHDGHHHGHDSHHRDDDDHEDEKKNCLRINYEYDLKWFYTSCVDSLPFVCSKMAEVNI